MAARILVVEDDPEIQQFLQQVLEGGGYLVQPAASAEAALRWLREPSAKPDLVLLDIGLPDKDMDGLSLCRALKKDATTRKIPVAVLSGQTSNEKRLEAMSAQADLMLGKPVSVATLLDAVGKLLARPKSERRGVLHRGSLEVDPDARTVFYQGVRIDDLGQRLFDVLYLLVEHCPNPVTPRYVLSALHLKEKDAQVAVIVSRLRKRLHEAFGADMIATVPGQGYRLDLPASQAAPIR
jgi:DNA-binding response OmpR family regulator